MMILWTLIALLVLVITGTFVGSYVSPEFAAVAPILSGGAMAPLVTLITFILSRLLAKTSGLEKAVEEEVEKGEKGEAVE